MAGKVVLVTGSATGVGEGIARRLAHEGATVVVHDREGVEPAFAGEFALTGDLEDPATPARLVAQTVERFGKLDGVVNNAGISSRGGLEADAAFFDRMIAINARAPFLMCQAARPYLAAQKGGIVNIGSIHARHGGGDMVPYAMSKAALANLTRTLAHPLAKDAIRINALNLGWTLTPNERQLLIKTAGWEADWPETMGAKMPFGRLLSPDDVAGMVAYLLSDEAAMISGQVWDFDQRSHGG